MNRQQVREFIQAAADNLGVSFNSGRVSEFNSEADKQYPYIWLESLQVSTEMTATQTPIDSWQCRLHIMKLDGPGSSPTEYEGIVDECDRLAQRVVRLLNQEISGYKLITLTGITRVPDIHSFADNLSGVVLSFDLNGADTTDLC